MHPITASEQKGQATTKTKNKNARTDAMKRTKGTNGLETEQTKAKPANFAQQSGKGPKENGQANKQTNLTNNNK